VRAGLAVSLLLVATPLACAGLGARPAPGPGAASLSPALQEMRLRLADEVAIVTEGDVGAGFTEKLKTAVQLELTRAGLTVVAGQDAAPADLLLRLECRVRGAVYFLHGHVAMTVESGGLAIEMVRVDDELHRDSEFPELMARRLVAAFARSAAVVALAEKKHPHARRAREEARAPEPGPSSDGVAEARRRSGQGTALYNLGRYKEALGEYEAAYLAAPAPELLFNIGQCHRKIGNRKEALSFFRTYLRNAPRARNRAEVEARIAELDAEERRSASRR
jgi:tetratricopeptide (TPR) repeat protein